MRMKGCKRILRNGNKCHMACWHAGSHDRIRSCTGAAACFDCRPVKLESTKTPRQAKKKVSVAAKRSHNSPMPKCLKCIHGRVICAINSVVNSNYCDKYHKLGVASLLQ